MKSMYLRLPPTAIFDEMAIKSTFGACISYYEKIYIGSVHNRG
jgi:hypothetical protein